MAKISSNMIEIEKLKKLVDQKLSKKTEKLAKLLEKICVEEGSHFFHRRMIIIILSFLIICSDVVFRGAYEKSIVGIENCTQGDWLVFGICCAASFVLAMFTLNYLKHSYALKKRAGYIYHYADVQWRYITTARFMMIAFICGFLGGILGIGEGTIYIPLMVELGKHPLVASATGMYLVIIDSFTIGSMLTIEKYPDISYIILLSVIAVIGSFIGCLITDGMIKKYKRPSFMLFLIAFNCLVASILVPGQTILRIFMTPRFRNSLWEIGHYCAPKI